MNDLLVQVNALALKKLPTKAKPPKGY
jgi:hypothetical protein